MNSIEGNDWYKHGVYRNNILQAYDVAFFIGKKDFAKENLPFGVKNLLFIGDECYIRQSDFDEMMAIILKKMSFPYLKEYFDGHQKDNENLLTAAGELAKQDYSNAGPQELIAALQRYRKAASEVHHWLWSMEYVNAALDTYIRQAISSAYPSWDSMKIDSFIYSIADASKPLAFQEEIAEILADKDIKELYKKYAWLSINFSEGMPFSFEEYQKRVAQMDKSKLKQDIKLKKQHVHEAEKLLQGVQDANLRDLLTIVQDLMWLKTYRIDAYSQSWYLIRNLWKRACRVIGADDTTLKEYTFDEIIELIEHPIPVQRRPDWTIVRQSDTVSLVLGQQSQIKKRIIRSLSLTALQGVGAYPGKIVGTARVILNDREIDTVKKGEILVCNLTNPNYNPVFDKLIGMVTDEGGILCHSAIMAREFKIPTVIGTKYATQMIKTGDKIEMDAEKGIVRLL